MNITYKVKKQFARKQIMKKVILLLCSISICSLGAEISKPFAQGVAFNDLKWEARFNMPDCDNEGGKINAWCLQSKDMKKSVEKSGVEAKLASWINDPKIKSLYLAYFSFSNEGVKKALCDGVNKRADLNLNIFINYDSYESLTKYFSKCGDNKNVRIYSRGKGPFSSSGAYLQHAKIFLGLETPDLKSIFENDEQFSEKRIRFTSSSANMSSYGTNLHFENWLFFDAREDDYVAQQNICVFKAYGNEEDSLDSKYKGVFKQRYADCVQALNKSKKVVAREDIKFYLVPLIKSAKYNFERPYDAMKRVVLSAKENVYVAIHRLMTGKITKDLFATIALTDVNFEIIYDDDTLRFGKEDGGDFFDVDRNDVMNYRMLRRKADQIYFMETNAKASGESGRPHLFHNKFIVVDDKYLFQGAGNFTASSLNITEDGNIENFYLIEIPEIVKVYGQAWQLLKQRATRQEDHEIYNHEDKVY